MEERNIHLNEKQELELGKLNYEYHRLTHIRAILELKVQIRELNAELLAKPDKAED